VEVLDPDDFLRLPPGTRRRLRGVTTETMPVVLPVDFVLDGERIVFSSALGTGLYVAATVPR
jgi:hypothetical protein